MSDKKIISINPELFSLKSNNTTRKKRKIDENKPIKIKPNSIKNKSTKGKILKYIREQQENKYKELFEDSKRKNTDPPKTYPSKMDNLDTKTSDFEDSLNYFKTLEEEHKNKEVLQKNTHNTTIKQNHMNVDEYFKSVLQNPVIESNGLMNANLNPLRFPSPNYGCLKNGVLPTYRNYRNMLHQTQKNKVPHYNHGAPIIHNPMSNYSIGSVVYPNNISGPSSMPPPNLQNLQNLPNLQNIERIKKISEHTQINQLIEKNKNKNKNPKGIIYPKQKKTVKRTFYLGKSRIFPRIGVLVSNRTMRKKITTHKYLLKQETISNIRKFLVKKGFIKVGSIAPNDVLREMYESTILIGGDVKNHNPENLLYNYMHG